jgi:hypothetical protein
MAANDYYTDSHSQDTAYNGGRRQDAPLPPVPPIQHPADSTSSVNISPVTSPFSDQAYPTYPHPSQHNLQTPHSKSPAPTYYSHGPDAAGSRYSYGGDPFGDQNAIPLQTQGYNNKPLPDVNTSPTYAMGEAEQALPPPGRKSRRADGYQDRDERDRRKKGWFTGGITWAVFLLSSIQLIVFIVELVKNGAS